MTVLSEVLNNDLTSVYYLNSRGDFETLNSFSQLIEPQRGKYFFASPYLSFGDYDNSCQVERANVRYMIENYDDDIVIKRGSYGWEAVYIDVLCENEEIIEILQALENYPVICENTLYEVEEEMSREHWFNCYESDLITALQKRFDYDNIDIDDNEELYALVRSLDIEIRFEAGGNVYFDIDAIVECIETFPHNCLTGEKY